MTAGAVVMDPLARAFGAWLLFSGITGNIEETKVLHKPRQYDRTPFPVRRERSSSLKKAQHTNRIPAILAAVILILPVYRKYVTMQNKVSRLEQEDRELRMEYQTLLKEVHDLETESLAVEKIAREKYKLCRENEQILIYK